MSWDDEDRADIRFHWRGAYVINGGDDVWVATRTDNGRTLFAESPDVLRDKIRHDYESEPVSRPPRTGRET